MLDELSATVEGIRASLPWAEPESENGRGRDARDEHSDIFDLSLFGHLDDPTPDEPSVAEVEREADNLQRLDRLVRLWLVGYLNYGG
jgi:hypothetical protein